MDAHKFTNQIHACFSQILFNGKKECEIKNRNIKTSYNNFGESLYLRC